MGTNSYLIIYTNKYYTSHKLIQQKSNTHTHQHNKQDKMGFLANLFSYEYISEKHLKGLDSYKYSCVDTSPLSKHVMQPLWNTLVNALPRWLAPNVLTFTGFMFLILEFALFTVYDYSFFGWCEDRDLCTTPDGLANLSSSQSHFYDNLSAYTIRKSETSELAAQKVVVVPASVCSCVPRILWLILAICQLLSHHLDGMDGKQARRTGSSSPLGELFDHGLDSWATLFLPVAIFSIFGRTEPDGLSVLRMYGIMWLIMSAFIISHWEKYNTGVLVLPWSYDLSQVGMTLCFFVTYFVGQKFWFMRIPYLPGDVSLIAAIEICIYVASLGLSLPFSIQNMYNAFANKTNKQSSVYESVRPLFSTFYLFFIQMVWIKYSPNNILELEPRVFLWLTGTLFSNIACRLVIAQMTSTRCQIFNWAFIPLTAIVVFLSFGLKSTMMSEVYGLYFIALLVTLSHIHYGICMVRQICDHLNIYCFVITSKPPPKKKQY